MKHERYILVPSEKQGFWVCTDNLYKIVITWEEHLFNKTQKITELEDSNATANDLAKLLQEMGNWLREKHSEKMF